MPDDEPFVSPYLLRPLRSYAEALRDRAAALLAAGTTKAAETSDETTGATATPEDVSGDREA